MPATGDLADDEAVRRVLRPGGEARDRIGRIGGWYVIGVAQRPW